LIARTKIKFVDNYFIFYFDDKLICKKEKFCFHSFTKQNTLFKEHTKSFKQISNKNLSLLWSFSSPHGKMQQQLKNELQVSEILIWKLKNLTRPFNEPKKNSSGMKPEKKVKDENSFSLDKDFREESMNLEEEWQEMEMIILFTQKKDCVRPWTLQHCLTSMGKLVRLRSRFTLKILLKVREVCSKHHFWSRKGQKARVSLNIGRQGGRMSWGDGRHKNSGEN
jgi:hypothetical protein